MAEKKLQPIIIKRIKKGGHAVHGGAWKIAYADFVTAMMAFFLLMWLLNATTEKQRQGLADYFNPTIVNTPSGGNAGVDGGQARQAPDAAAEATATSFQMPVAHALIALAARDLIDADGFPQDAYDFLTTPWNWAFGPAHPDDDTGQTVEGS